MMTVAAIIGTLIVCVLFQAAIAAASMAVYGNSDNKLKAVSFMALINSLMFAIMLCRQILLRQ